MPVTHTSANKAAAPAGHNDLPAGHIVVTGGTGLVGSHLLQQLAGRGSKVVALHRGAIPTHLQLPGITWQKGDILDIFSLEEAMQGAAQVYHCAAIVTFHPKRRAEMMKINVEGTANVVNTALLCGVQKLLFVSSVAALGRLRPGQMINETMHWTPQTSNSAYGKSKYLAEMEVWRGIGEGLQAVMVNPSIILGAADWNKGSAGIFKSAYNQFPWYTEGSGGFVDVEDVVEAMIRLMQSNISGQRFILNAINTTYRNIFTQIAHAFGKRPPYKKVTPLLAGVLWRWEAIKAIWSDGEPLLTRETAQTALTPVAYDNAKITGMLPGFHFTPIDSTIRRVCQQLAATNR